jgi:hypothetical protein
MSGREISLKNARGQERWGLAAFVSEDGARYRLKETIDGKFIKGNRTRRKVRDLEIGDGRQEGKGAT